MPKLVYLKAHPRVEVEELYHFQADVRETAITTPMKREGGRPMFSGKVRTTFPYYLADDDAGVNRPASIHLLYLEIEKLLRKESDAVTMFLGLTRPPFEGANPLSGIDQALELNRGVAKQVFPIGNYKELRQENRAAVREREYPIGTFPENSFDVEMLAEIENDYETAPGTESSFQSFKREQELTLTIRVRHVLPGGAQPMQWYLDYLCIDWPFERAWALRFRESDTRMGDVGYDPELRQISLVGPRPLEGPDDKKWVETKVSVSLDQPCRVHDVGEIHGRVFIKAGAPDGSASGAISGLAFKTFAANGVAKTGSRVIYRNGVAVDFTIDLAGIFRKRSFLVERHLTFDGVIPEKGRFSDIVGALQDAAIDVPAMEWSIPTRDQDQYHGYDIPPADALRDLQEEDRIKFRVEANKRVGGSDCRISVNVLGEKMQATRQLALAGGGFTQATINTGKIEISIWAEHADFKELNRLFDKVEATLRDRLDRFRIL